MSYAFYDKIVLQTPRYRVTFFKKIVDTMHTKAFIFILV